MKIGDRITFKPCTRCEHASTGVLDGYTTMYASAELPERRGPLITWDPPPADCACGCHTPWRILNHVPVVAEVAA